MAELREIEDFIHMTEIDIRKIGRESRGSRAKWYLIYPDDRIK